VMSSSSSAGPKTFLMKKDSRESRLGTPRVKSSTPVKTKTHSMPVGAK
jgi:hypothetical protein